MQEHLVLFLTRLLSPPIPADYSGTESHLIGYAPFLNVLLLGISPIDTVQTFSLHGLVGEIFKFLALFVYSANYKPLAVMCVYLVNGDNTCDYLGNLTKLAQKLHV